MRAAPGVHARPCGNRKLDDAIRIVPIATVPVEAVEQLLDHAFGTDRHRRTAYRIREGVDAAPALSFAALDEDGALLGTIQCWPIALHHDDGAATPMIMLGPVAVEPAYQRSGIGQRLMAASLDAADRTGVRAIMLIGDPEYYGRFFGFTADHTTAWRVPGPVERHRLLARGPGVPHAAGVLGPRVPADA